MNDAELLQRLREVDRPVEPPAAFAEALYTSVYAAASRQSVRGADMARRRLLAVVTTCLAVIGTIAAVGLFWATPTDPAGSTGSPVPVATATPGTSPSTAPPPTTTTGPSASPSAAASPSLEPSVPAGMRWTEASLEQDWPGPLRVEPDGRPVVVDDHLDAAGDIGLSAPAWVDIIEVEVPSNFMWVRLAAAVPQPVTDPQEQWIAYGVVLDADGDGIPDARLGIDNMPASEEPGHRAWRTDLKTGRTEAAVGAPYGLVGTTYFDTFFPGEWEPAAARLGFGRASWHFYAWASVIEDGRVVATDYAPDRGWFDYEAER